MAEIDDLREEVNALRARVEQLEQQIKGIAQAVIQIDADGVTHSLMAGIIEGDVQIGASGDREPALKPKEWEFLRILVEADRAEQIKNSKISLYKSATQGVMRLNEQDFRDTQVCDRLMDVGMPLVPGLNSIVGQGLLRETGKSSYQILREAWDAVDRHFGASSE